MSASISIGEGIAWSSLEQAARESGETWPGEGDDLPVGERPTLPAPAGDVSTPAGADVPTALRALIDATRRRIARGLLDVTRIRDAARLNERDALHADETGQPRVAEWHRAQAKVWRGMAEEVRKSVREDEQILRDLERWVGGVS